jgi:hypothetical protein
VFVLHVASLMNGEMSVGVWPSSWPAVMVPPVAGVPVFGSVPASCVPSTERGITVATAICAVLLALLAPVVVVTTAAIAAKATSKLSSRGCVKRPAPGRLKGLNLMYSYPFGWVRVKGTPLGEGHNNPGWRRLLTFLPNSSLLNS